MVFVSSKLFSGSPGEYMLGCKQTTKAALLGVLCWWIFLSDLFFFHSPIRLPGRGNGPLFLAELQLGTRLGIWGVHRLITLGHYPPGVFNLGRDVYKCHCRCNFLSHFRGVQRIQGWQRQGELGWGVTSAICCLGLNACPPLIHCPPSVSMPFWAQRMFQSCNGRWESVGCTQPARPRVDSQPLPASCQLSASLLFNLKETVFFFFFVPHFKLSSQP